MSANCLLRNWIVIRDLIKTTDIETKSGRKYTKVVKDAQVYYKKHNPVTGASIEVDPENDAELKNWILENPVATHQKECLLQVARREIVARGEASQTVNYTGVR